VPIGARLHRAFLTCFACMKGTLMFGLGYGEIIIFALIVLVLFGGSRIPTLARSLGKSITEFKKGVAGIEEEQPPAEKETNKQA
jgi:sec-independent protein translocase protein TatA